MSDPLATRADLRAFERRLTWRIASMLLAMLSVLLAGASLLLSSLVVHP